ncbi:hypothetical protein [Rhodococcus sp. Eu-32]|nr:hypothetical protein [Rhodococcus sp. Eu-32]
MDTVIWTETAERMSWWCAVLGLDAADVDQRQKAARDGVAETSRTVIAA